MPYYQYSPELMQNFFEVKKKAIKKLENFEDKTDNQNLLTKIRQSYKKN